MFSKRKKKFTYAISNQSGNVSVLGLVFNLLPIFRAEGGGFALLSIVE